MVNQPWVNIRIDGTEMGSSTNFDGFIDRGSKTQTYLFIHRHARNKITVTKSTHNVVMEVNTTGLDEVVVVGYGTMKKRELTGAVSS